MTNEQMPQSEEAGVPGRARSPRTTTFGVAAVLAALAGFAAVYVSLQPAGNETAPASNSSDASTVTSSGSTGADTTIAAADTSLKAFAKGEMGTFVAKSSPAPVSAVVFRDYSTGDDGVAKSMDDWKGKVVLLNLWATWCAPCRKEMPDLLKLKQELGGENFDVVAVSIDRGGPEKPRKFLNQINAQSLGLYQSTSSEIAGPLKAFGMPTTILFDRNGHELGRLVGPADWASAEAKTLIKAAIERSGAS